MATDDWQRISAIFHEALAKPREERATFIGAACEGDEALRTRLERLLAAEENAGGFGEAPLYASAQLASLAREQAAPGGSAADAADNGAMGRPDSGRRWPFLGFVLAAAAATAATFAYAVWLLIAAGGVAPWLGWQGSPQGMDWIVSSVAQDGPAALALQPGDLVRSFDGTPPGPDRGLLLHLRELAPGDAYDLVVERAGQRSELRLRVGRATNANQLVYFGVSLVWCLVGLFIGFARPAAVLARLACVTALAVGLVFLQVSVIRSGLLWQPLHAVLGFHFLARFPTGEPTRGVWRAGLIAAYVGGGLTAVLGLATHALTLVNGADDTLALMIEHAALLNLQWPVGLLAFAIAVLGMVLALAHNYRRLTQEDHRRRVRWVVYGGLVGLAPQLWWAAVSLLDAYAGIRSLSRFDLLANAATVTIPLTMAYAVVRHRVLDIRVVIRRGLRYLLARRALQAVVALPFLALIYMLIRNRDLTLTELASETAGLIVWLVLAAGALRFRQPLALWIDRRFFREELDREQLMMRLLDESRRVESLSELSHLVSHTIVGAMHPSSALVWYRDPRERLDTAASMPALSAADFPAGEALLVWLEQQGTAISLPMLEAAGLAREAVGWLEQRGIAVVVPMTDSTDRLVGALFLGGKKSEEPYDEQDSTLLDAVARQTAVIRENLRLRARLSEEVRVRHDVLARLDEQIPDLLKECPSCGACFDGPLQRCPEDDGPLGYSLPVARTIDARYRLERLLGKGGMGAVYEARDLRLARRVAVKIMLSKGLRQTGTLRRFRREARAAARMSHPNIVAVYDFGSLDGEVAYIVMEKINGETLRTVLDRERTLEPSAAREWFDPILAGIATAHANGIVHRDLKPENVMGWRNDGGVLEVKILDLGLAKLRATERHALETMTQEGLVMGTPNYMSPEQLLGREVDQRADIYAIGVMMLEVLTGRLTRPSDPPGRPDLTSRGHGLPAALRELIERCLSTDPADRPGSAPALKKRLQAMSDWARSPA